jgi:multidrug efflux pump subunit AcrB
VVKVFIVLFFVCGLLASSQLKRETLPEIDFSQVVIRTLYPGAAPHDVELNVSKNIEDELREVDGLDKFISVSADNVSVINIWVDIDEENPEQVKADIRKAVDRAQGAFPEKAEEPDITEIKTGNIPVIRYLISSETLPESELRLIARNLETELEDLESVARVNKIGYREPEIKVMGDLAQMKFRNISLREMADAIRNFNIRSGGGSIESVLTEKSIITLTEFTNLKEVENVIIRSTFEDIRIQIKDVARVVQDFEERNLYARGNRKNGIILEVLKKERYDIIQTVDTIKEKVKGYCRAISSCYKGKAEIFSIFDITTNTRKLLAITRNNALIGFVLVLIALFVFLEFRVAFWTAFGIPMALMIVFIVMSFLDFSINNISLFGLITVLGILVDDGIVAGENIFRKKELGLRGKEAAIEGAFEVFHPLLATVLTTILAFLPLAFMGGIMGKFLYQLPIVIIIALTASLIEVFMGLPAHLAKASVEKERMGSSKKWFHALLAGYRWILKRTLKVRYLVIILFVTLLFLSVLMARRMDFILFSNKETDLISITLEAPEGINLEEMLRRTRKAEQAIIQSVPYEKELDSLVSVVGSTSFSSLDRTTESSNTANIQVFLVPYADRERTAAGIIPELREKLQSMPDFKKVLLEERRPGPPVGAPVEAMVISNDDKIRRDFTEEIKTFLKKQPGLFSLEDDSENIKNDIRIQFDFIKMYRLGVNPATVAATVRMAFKGEKVSSILKADEDVNIVVQLKPKYKRDIRFLKQLLIPTKYGKQIYLDQIASFPERETQMTIKRFNGRRATTLTAQLDFSKNTPTRVMNALENEFAPKAGNIPQLKLKLGGEGEETQKSIRETGFTFIFAIFGIFMILLLVFRSLTQPFLILSVIPFGFIGIILAFNLHGEPLGFFAMIGGIGLAGVIVNDSIVMVDYINKLKKDAVKKKDMLHTVVEGAGERLRPILLTTITTVAGLFPTVYGWGGSNPMLRPLTMALAYGLIFGTTITLFMIPSFYLIDQDFKRLVYKIGHWFAKGKDKG